MLQPKRTRFRKQHKGKNRGIAQVGNTVAFGEFGLKATDRGRITAREIEAARRAMTRYVKRGGKIWIRVFPDVPVTVRITLSFISLTFRLPRARVCSAPS
jgi:large subunit ribosomal protein L16